jgi:hypothetical protein
VKIHAARIVRNEFENELQAPDNGRIPGLGRYLFMPAFRTRPAQLASRHPWLWGVYLGAVIGLAVVLLSALKGGFRPALLLVGLVLLLVFGGIAVIGGFAGRYTPGGPT